jgi:lipopolysaccharide biosynthesis glycosyltransferase
MGEDYKKISKITHPNIIKYVETLNDVDFIVLNEEYNKEIISPHWAKFELFKLLNEYDRIIYLDTDLIIREDCPDLFKIVPEDMIGMYDEGKFINRISSLTEASLAYKQKMKIKQVDARYYNTGVMVLSKQHKSLLAPPPEQKELGMYEQGYLNLKINNEKIKNIHELTYHYNRMELLDTLTGESRLASYIVHYAGLIESYGIDNVLKNIEHDLEQWSKDSPKFEYKRNIIIRAGGGLGDQVCAEPVIRYCLERYWKDDNVEILCDWKEAFDHLGCKLHDGGTYKLPKDNEARRICHTLPLEDAVLWGTCSQTTMHQTDFAALSIIKRLLPDAEKEIQLHYNEQDLNYVRKLYDVDLKKLILIHPGKGWTSKTFPELWWQTIINGLIKNGYNVGIIGKSNPDDDDSGYVNTNTDGAYDFRNMLSIKQLIAIISQAPVLISNDSSPIHIAGAFENWIVLIPTCKHPDYILPTRKRSKYYKSVALYKKLTIDSYDSSPTALTYHGQINKVEDSIEDCLPDPVFVIKNIAIMMKD